MIEKEFIKRPDEIIKEYIKNQDLQERSNSDNFEIGETSSPPNLPALVGSGSVCSC